MSKPIQIVFLFISLVLLQVLVLNNIRFMGYINPYLYIVFIFLYPIRTNRFPILILAFLLGLCIDTFTNSGGIHAFSSLFIAYVRLFFIRTIFKKTTSEYQLFDLKLEPFDKIFNYITILTLIHHLLIFSFSNFGFSNYFNVILNTIFSTTFTLLIYFTGNFILSRKHS